MVGQGIDTRSGLDRWRFGRFLRARDFEVRLFETDQFAQPGDLEEPNHQSWSRTNRQAFSDRTESADYGCDNVKTRGAHEIQVGQVEGNRGLPLVDNRVEESAQLGSGGEVDFTSNGDTHNSPPKVAVTSKSFGGWKVRIHRGSGSRDEGIRGGRGPERVDDLEQIVSPCEGKGGMPTSTQRIDADHRGEITGRRLQGYSGRLAAAQRSPHWRRLPGPYPFAIMFTPSTEESLDMH